MLELRLFLPSAAAIFHSQIIFAGSCSGVVIPYCPASLAAGGPILSLFQRPDPTMAPPVAKGKHLTVKEQDMVDKVIRKDGGTPTDALQAVARSRARRGEAPIHKTTIYRYLRGSTHRRSKQERRGRPRLVKRADAARLDAARRWLIVEADNEWAVTHADVVREAGYEGHASARVLADALRSRGVRSRAPRSKVMVTAGDAKARLRVARAWVRRPASFWVDGVHAYVDNKAWPVPLTAQQRKRYRQARVTSHLRKPSEGCTPGFTKPRMKHSFVGLPSITVSAAVAQDRIIMWHVVAGAWNGGSAADMYEGPLLKALQKKWPGRRRFTIVEDGDRKGNQSGKGLRAKAAVGIKAMTLPPRTPSWMPLDYSLWTAIEDRMDASSPAGTETKEAYVARLAQCARALPKAFVRKVLLRMKQNIKGVIEARGYHAKND